MFVQKIVSMEDQEELVGILSGIGKGYIDSTPLMPRWVPESPHVEASDISGTPRNIFFAKARSQLIQSLFFYYVVRISHRISQSYS